jgi:hypothetical protein
MKKNILMISGLTVLSLAVFGLFTYVNYSMDSASVIRRLSGIRIAAGLFRMSSGRHPSDIGEMIKTGNLEAVPELKLRRHLATSKVRNASSPAVRDTGGWGYVNDPKSSDYGTVFIDCSHTDEKGRYWSWF